MWLTCRYQLNLKKIIVQGSSQKKIKEGCLFLRSKHSCGFDTFFRPHQMEFAKERGFSTLFDALARSL